MAPRSDAIEKYAMAPVVMTTIAMWWNSRVPRGVCAGLDESRDQFGWVRRRRTTSVHAVIAKRETAKRLNTAHSQLEPFVDK